MTTKQKTKKLMTAVHLTPETKRSLQREAKNWMRSLSAHIAYILENRKETK